MEHQAALLLGSLGCNEPHIGPGDCLADGLCVGGVILVAFDVRLHVGRWHPSHGVAKCLELARPMMRRGASLDANQAWWQLLEEHQDGAALQASTPWTWKTDFAMSRPIVVTVCMTGSSELWEFSSTHFRGTRVPVEEPSTASKADFSQRFRCRPAISVISFFKIASAKVS